MNQAKDTSIRRATMAPIRQPDTLRGLSGRDVPNHRGLVTKSTPHGNAHGTIQASASSYKSRRRKGTSPLEESLHRHLCAFLLRKDASGCLFAFARNTWHAASVNYHDDVEILLRFPIFLE